jgi:hypothetical protein
MLLALAARAGSRPKLAAAARIRPIGKLLLVMAAGAVISGVSGYFLAKKGFDYSTRTRDKQSPAIRRTPVSGGLVGAHGASYAIGFFRGEFYSAPRSFKDGNTPRLAERGDCSPNW